ncbi:MAG: chemotaxis response regulator protein-glutamate methylesterase [Pseudomonadota bacterium]
MNKIRVLTVDDSTLMQRILKSALEGAPNIEHVGQAFNSNEARKMVKQYNPDLLTLDVEMPGMNGLEFLERLMNARPLPVIMFSSHTADGTEITLKALELGAVDFLQKPREGLDKTLAYLKETLVPKIQVAGKTQPRYLKDRLSTLIKSSPDSAHTSPVDQKANQFAAANSPYELIAIGASTGGVSAIREVLEGLPGNLPPIVITQHMPEGYTERFAERLNRDCAMTVKEAANNDELEFGHAYIAPGTHHMRVVKSAGKKAYHIELDDGPIVSGHRPSVDAMFNSVNKTFPAANVVSVILTGMGRDGAEGMLNLRNSGSITFGQNQETCVVYGMPKSAFELGAVQHMLPLDGISDAVMDALCQSSGSQSKRHLA